MTTYEDKRESERNSIGQPIDFYPFERLIHLQFYTMLDWESHDYLVKTLETCLQQLDNCQELIDETVQSQIISICKEELEIIIKRLKESRED